MKTFRFIWYGVPLLAIALVGMIVCLASAVTDFAWLDRVELWISGQAEELHGRLRQ